MIRKSIAVVAMSLAGALTLAACGSSSSPLSSSPQTPAAGSSVAASAAAAGSETSEAPPAGSSSEAESASPSASSAAGDMTPASSPASSGQSSEAAGGPIVIGSANFTESELIAQIYAVALQAKGVDVSTKLDIGSREIYLKAMHEGSVNLLPEYTGGLLAYYDKTSTATSPDDVYAALTKAVPDDLKVLDMSPAQDQDSVTVTKQTADKYHLTSIGDLAKVAGTMTLGGSSEWQTRADGPQGLKKVYGVVFKDYKVLDPGGPLSVKGLTTGLVQATDIFTTNPAIQENNFVVLKDPKSLFQAQNVVPLIAKKVASSTVTDTLNAVSKKLTTKDLTSLLEKIQTDKSDPEVVAKAWVSSAGLG